MKKEPDSGIRLAIAARTELAQVVVAFVKQSALAFGFGKSESRALTVAAEAVFSYLSRHVLRREVVDIEMHNGFFYVKVIFRFHVKEVDLAGFNLTSPAGLDGRAEIEERGLVMATRSVDYVEINDRGRDEIEVSLRKDKDYEVFPPVPVEAAGVLESFVIEEPVDEMLKALAVLIARTSTVDYRPGLFRSPGKIMDMVKAGEIRALVARDGRHNLGGGFVFYHHLSEKIITGFGPFVFCEDKNDEIGRALLDECFRSVARTKVFGLMIPSGLPVSLRDDFECVGSLRHEADNGDTVELPIFFRLLHEDPGAVVWTDDSLRGFLEDQYTRLFLARDIRTVTGMGESGNRYSLLSTRVESGNDLAFILPLRAGGDLHQNITAHIKMLKTLKVRNVIFYIDVGIPWHARAIPSLRENGFVPKIVIPFGGEADRIAFQIDETRP
jgi:hypothetical protein